MEITKKIKTFLKSRSSGKFYNMFDEITNYFSSKYNIGIDYEIIWNFLSYWESKKISPKKEEWEKEILCEKINTDFIKYLINKKYWKKQLLNLFDLTENEFNNIKNNKWSSSFSNKRKIRRNFEYYVYSRESIKIKFSWEIPKKIKKLEEILNSEDYNFQELEELKIRLNDFQNMKMVLNANSLKKAIKENSLDEDFRYFEVKTDFIYRPFLYCYKTKKEYMMQQCDASNVFLITFDDESSVNFLNWNFIFFPIEKSNLIKIKGLSGDQSYKIKSTWINDDKSVLLTNIPNELINAFNKNRLIYSEQKSFELLKDDIENNYIIYSEFDPISKETIGQDFIVSTNDFWDTDVEQINLKNSFFKMFKKLKYISFNVDLKIKKILFDEKTNFLKVVCFINSELNEHIKNKNAIFDSINSDIRISLTDKEIIFSSENLFSLLPQNWIDFCDEIDNGFWWLIKDYFLTLCIDIQEKDYKNYFSFTKRCY